MNPPFRFRRSSFLMIFAVTVGTLAAVKAATLTFPRGQTLGGWNERVFTTTWTSLAPNEPQSVTIDSNGDFRGFDHPTSTVWLQSPEFILGDGPIIISQIYLVPGTAGAPETDADVNAAKSATGWVGIALRDTAGNFVLTYDSATTWQPVIFSAQDLAPFTGQTFTLNFINSNNSSSDALYVNRPIEISVIPEPGSISLVAVALVPALHRRRRDR